MTDTKVTLFEEAWEEEHGKDHGPNTQALVRDNPECVILVADGFDSAIIGYDSDYQRVIYSTEKCIEVLAKDMPYDDAVEYFDFNVAGSHMGEHTPIFKSEVTESYDG